jgi:23S rRNA pseudouridine1911/1915/1917 synthase
VKLYPKTGRTHQLRVHLNSIGHPIFCDNSYGGGPKNAKSFHIRYTQIINYLLKTMNRVALHASMIKICHPETLVEMEFKAPLPKDFKRALEILNDG